MIGAGNVATHVASTLTANGCAPIQVWSRSFASASALAAVVGCEAVTDMDKVASDADIYIISVVDSALADVIGALCKDGRNGLFVHTAGTMPMQLFEGHAEHYGVLYPMQTFSKCKELDFKTVPCFVEASDSDSLSEIKELAGVLSDSVYELSGDNRRWLHVAAVFACNFSNACCSLAARILEEHGLDFSVMLPLVDETVKKLHAMSPTEAQTGPAVRGDRNVMGRHIAMLESDNELQSVYRLMSEIITNNRNGK